MPTLHKIDPAEARLNVFFSAPVYFDDGQYLFLPEGKSIKPYHLAALKRWQIPYLLTAGHIVEESEGTNIERMAGFDKMRLAQQKAVDSLDDAEEIPPLEAL